MPFQNFFFHLLWIFFFESKNDPTYNDILKETEKEETRRQLNIHEIRIPFFSSAVYTVE